MKKFWLPTGVAFVIFLISACGGDSSTTEESGSVMKAAAPSGEDIYKRTCIACHQANGEGIANSFPPLAKSDYLANKEKAIMQVLKGSSGDIVVNGNKFNNTMPPQALSDDEIASVLTYVYGNFGNNGGTVTPSEVKGLRGKL